jgi:hypothetical protein
MYRPLTEGKDGISGSPVRWQDVLKLWHIALVYLICTTISKIIHAIILILQTGRLRHLPSIRTGSNLGTQLVATVPLSIGLSCNGKGREPWNVSYKGPAILSGTPVFIGFLLNEWPKTSCFLVLVSLQLVVTLRPAYPTVPLPHPTTSSVTPQYTGEKKNCQRKEKYPLCGLEDLTWEVNPASVPRQQNM